MIVTRHSSYTLHFKIDCEYNCETFSHNKLSLFLDGDRAYTTYILQICLYCIPCNVNSNGTTKLNTNEKNIINTVANIQTRTAYKNTFEACETIFKTCLYFRIRRETDENEKTNAVQHYVNGRWLCVPSTTCNVGTIHKQNGRFFFFHSKSNIFFVLLPLKHCICGCVCVSI